MQWESVIGLEVHVQLNTRTKLFCNCPTSFGDTANTHTCPLCMGHPGVLPVLNIEALNKAVLAGLALGCEIGKFSKFDRKNYFYPDLPKAYQITQFEKPVCLQGSVNISVKGDDDKEYNKDIGITRIHLEEDAGKLVHSEQASIRESYIDLNRAGTPLIEIVSEPDISTAAEAVAYLKKLRAIMLYIGVSDCSMEQGSMRCDANVSIRPAGEKKLGNRTEIKNMNSFKGINAAIEYEIRRQQRVLEDGGKIEVETLLFDPETGKTRSMRSKEEAHDYRYFPEPDLVPSVLTDEQIEEFRKSLPELPDEKMKRFISKYKLSDYDAGLLVSDRDLAAYFEEALKACPAEPKKICNWLLGDVSAYLNEQSIEIKDFSVPAADIGGLVAVIQDGTISGKIAKDLFPEMISSGKSPSVLIEEKGLKQISDDGAIREAVQKVLAASPDQVQQYKDGNKKIAGFFVGQVMKATGGKANPKMVNQLLAEMLG